MGDWRFSPGKNTINTMRKKGGVGRGGDASEPRPRTRDCTLVLFVCPAVSEEIGAEAE